jgi:cell wall assembly regulator SMI1
MNHAQFVAKVTSQIKFLTSAGAEIQSWSIEPPATDKDIETVERQLGFSLPIGLRRVFSEVAASVDFDWVNPDEDFEDHDLFVAKGAVNWNLQKLVYDVDLARKWSRDDGSDWSKVWMTTLPVIDVGCGDYIGIALSDMSAVTYLNHEAPDAHGVVFARDFGDFLHHWSELMFPGPDWAYWQPFVSGESGYLDSSTSVATDWKNWLAGKL